MSVGIHIRIDGTAGELLDRLLAQLGDAGKRTMEEAAAKSVAAMVRKHLFALGNTRHATAGKLGAAPTNVIGRTAENVAVRQGDGGTEVVVPHPLFWRAFGDVAIRPKNAKALAIPVSGAAYDKAPRSFTDLFVWKSKKGNKFLARRNGERLSLLYLLKDGVTQRKDPSLLPTMDELSEAGKQGIAGLIHRIIARQGNIGGAA